MRKTAVSLNNPFKRNVFLDRMYFMKLSNQQNTSQYQTQDDRQNEVLQVSATDLIKDDTVILSEKHSILNKSSDKNDRYD